MASDNGVTSRLPRKHSTHAKGWSNSFTCRSIAVNENLRMLTLHARMFPLCCGCGKHSHRKPLIVVRLGHPLRCLVVASCGSNAAKGLRKHSAKERSAAKINIRWKSVLSTCCRYEQPWRARYGTDAVPNKITPLAHVHERNLKSDLLELKSAEYALSKQAWRGSLWHNHVGKSRPKYYPELKLTSISGPWYPANAVNTGR